MARWFDTLGARTPEEAARRRFGLWSLGLFVLVLPLWWLWGADLFATALRPLAGLVFRLFGLSGEIAVLADGSWRVGTHLTSGGVPISYDVPHTSLRRILLGFPLALAFLSAPPRTPRPVRAAAVTLVSLTLLFILSATSLIWGDLAAQLNPALAPPSSAERQALDQPPLPALVAQVAVIGRYIGMSVAPLIAAALLWAALNPAGRSIIMDDNSLKD